MIVPGRLLPARLIAATAIGATAAAGLVWSMQWLILREPAPGPSTGPRPVMEFVRLRREPEVQLKKRELPEEPPPPETSPTPPSLSRPSAPKIVARAPKIDTRVPSFALDMAAPYVGPVEQGPADRDFVVLSRLAPRYPYRAERKGIEGWVRLSFEITPEGTVRDVVVVEADPQGVFDTAAVRAVRQWKFKPRIRDGRPVAVRTEQTIDFRLRKRDS